MRQYDRTEIINGWLKYHNTTVDEILKKYPKECKSGEWFSLFKVTQEQHDEWVVWAKKRIKQMCKVSDLVINKSWPYIYLNDSPTIIDGYK